ncbi:MerR family transcriptional regulator [Streptomyces sp. NPDC051940]|uniref:helix-turn-helix domain-containing protein n=1 Tax=Streptomyces sp. NPDC051940 TaxID=3155675 RepID=UPI0034185DD4
MKSSADMSIGELAARFRLAPHVLRHWEAMGLLAPATRVNGRRRYGPEDVNRVAMIVGGKKSGLSLEQLRDLFAVGGPADRRDLLERHKAELTERMRALQASMAMVEHALDCEEHDFTQCPNFKAIVADLAAGGRLDPAGNPETGSAPVIRSKPYATSRTGSGFQ